jgi:hypothetical protein
MHPFLVAVFLSATPTESALSAARDVADDASEAPAPCRKKVTPRLDGLMEALRAGDAAVAKRRAAALQDAVDDFCTGASAKRLTRGVNAVLASLEAPPAPAAAPVAPPKVLSDLAAGLGGLFAGGQASQTTETKRTETSTSTRTEEIDGEPQEGDSRKKPDMRSSSQRAIDAANVQPGKPFKATCQKNADCASNTCYRGTGTNGYCTLMCTSWTECGSGFDCIRPYGLNAPQSLCLQSR